MSSVVNFIGNGTSFGKKRKVMPGTNKVFKPEIEQVNWVHAGDDVEAVRTNFNNIVVAPTAFSKPTTSTSFRCWDFIPFPRPRIDEGQTGTRKGDRVIYRYARFKGFIVVTNHLAHATRWRMVLYRMEDITISDPTDINVIYPKFYNNWRSYTSTDTNDSIEAAFAHNYYAKVARTDCTNWCRHKVIASGVIPRTFTISRVDGVTGDSSGAGTFSGSIQANSTPATYDEAMYIPLDVKVKLDDNVDFSVMYYLSIELDNLTALEWSAASNSVIRVQTYEGAPVKFYFFTRLYYEDY